jgi:hypothetical protein
MPPSIPRVGSFENIEELVPREQSRFGLHGDPGKTNQLIVISASNFTVDGGYSGIPFNLKGPAVGMNVLVDDFLGLTTAASTQVVRAGINFSTFVFPTDEVQILDEGATPANSNVGVYRVTLALNGVLVVQLPGGGPASFGANTLQHFRVLDIAPASVDLGFEKGDKILLTAAVSGPGDNLGREFTLVDPATLTVLEAITTPDTGSTYEYSIFKRLGG